jgi:hypothetical protein
MAAILALYEGSGLSAPINHPLLARLKKGFIVLRTSRRVEHWALIPVAIVVEWLKSLSPNARLVTDVLQLKLLMLSAILLIVRPSDLAKLKRPDLAKIPKEYVPLVMLAFKNDYGRSDWAGKMYGSSSPALDWRECCAQWLSHTAAWVRDQDAHLFLSLNSPHKELLADRISNLLTEVAKRAGLDSKVFMESTFRLGAVQAYLEADVEPDCIMQIGRW